MQLSLVKHAEVQALRRALGNVAALSSLPSIWLNADERQIADSLADALLRVLDLTGVRVELSPDSGETIEAERSSKKEQLPLGDALKRAFPDGQPLGPPRDFERGGELRAVCLGIGIKGGGRLYAVAGRADFPTEGEHLALVMAANQAAVAWQRARAERALRAQTEVLNTERNEVAALNRSLSNERDRLRQLFEQAPGFMAIMHGPQHVFEMCNKSYNRLIGEREVHGRSARAVFPDLEGQPFFKLLDEVYATGVPHVSTAAQIDLRRTAEGPLERRYLDFIYQPILDHRGEVSGIFAEGHDVTDLIKAQEQLALREELFRLATAAADVGTWDLDLETGILTWCDRTKAMFGISPGVPCSMDDFYAGLHPDDLEATSEAFASAIDPQRRSTYDVEYRTVGKEDGVTRWVAAKGKGLFTDDRCIRAIGTAINITSRKAAEERLRKSEASLRELNVTLEARIEEQSRERARIWENSRDLHVVVGPDGTFRAISPAWKRILGHEPDEVANRPVLDFVWPDDVEMTRRGFEWAVSEDLTNFEHRLWHKDGTPRWLSWHTSAEGDLLYAYGRDVTIEKQQTAALREAEEHLRHAQKMEAIGQLTGGVAHDFNNLLTIIRGSADLLRRKDLPEEKRRRYVEAISDTADRAAKLTSQLLAFARRQALRPQVFNAAEQLEAVSEMLKSVLGSRVALDLQLVERNACVEADVSQFETALVNLAANARDAMEGEGRLTIRLECLGPAEDSTAGRLAFSVADTGCGIPADQLNKIFEPFYTTKEAGHGTGLGLSQVYGFAQQSGGQVSVRSEFGIGTTFALILPTTMKPLEPTLVHLPSGQQQLEGCVLMVEDNPEVGDFSSRLLNDLGFDTVLATSGEEALKLLTENPHRFDLVFSDVVMPGMGGVALGEEVRRRFPHLPVVLTSGYSHVLAKGGPQGFELLHKPYSVESLSRVIRRAMSHRLRGRISP